MICSRYTAGTVMLVGSFIVLINVVSRSVFFLIIASFFENVEPSFYRKYDT